jgi:hypothetical protein
MLNAGLRLGFDRLGSSAVAVLGRELVEAEFAANLGVERVARGPLEVGRVLNGHEGFVQLADVEVAHAGDAFDQLLAGFLPVVGGVEVERGGFERLRPGACRRGRRRSRSAPREIGTRRFARGAWRWNGASVRVRIVSGPFAGTTLPKQGGVRWKQGGVLYISGSGLYLNGTGPVHSGN